MVAALSIPRTTATRFSRRRGFRAWHSHTVNTVHPSRRSKDDAFRSRSTFWVNFFCQNFTRVAGVVAYRQPRWRCQKHPLTKMATRRVRSTTSGRPGRVPASSRNLSPAACKARRTANSGAVLLRRTAAIMRLRVFGSTMSLIYAIAQRLAAAQAMDCRRTCA